MTITRTIVKPDGTTAVSSAPEITELNSAVNVDDIRQRRGQGAQPSTRKQQSQPATQPSQEAKSYQDCLMLIEAFDKGKLENSSEVIQKTSAFLRNTVGIPGKFNINDVKMEVVEKSQIGDFHPTGNIAVYLGTPEHPTLNAFRVIIDPKTGEVMGDNPNTARGQRYISLTANKLSVQNFYDNIVTERETLSSTELAEYKKLTGAFVSGDYQTAQKRNFILVERSKGTEYPSIMIYEFDRGSDTNRIYTRTTPEASGGDRNATYISHGGYQLEISYPDKNLPPRIIQQASKKENR